MLADSARPLVEMARVLVEAGATELSAVRAAIVLAQGGSYEDAAAELVLADEVRTTIPIDGEVFHPEMLICRYYGGGGNRTRVTCPTDSPLSSGNTSGSSDDEPSPPLVALRVLPREAVSAARETGR
jgi:hypothetical protein